jgi:hypothetical protein
MSTDLKTAAARKGSFLGTLRAVAWSFFGVRRRRGLEQDVSQLNPVHVVIAGVLGGLLFVLGLLLLVNWLVARAGAA